MLGKVSDPSSSAEFGLSTPLEIEAVVDLNIHMNGRQVPAHGDIRANGWYWGAKQTLVAQPGGNFPAI